MDLHPTAYPAARKQQGGCVQSTDIRQAGSRPAVDEQLASARNEPKRSSRAGRGAGRQAAADLRPRQRGDVKLVEVSQRVVCAKSCKNQAPTLKS